MSTSKNGHINIIKDFQPAPMVHVDKSKLLHILINLIQNAKEAVQEYTRSPIKEIHLLIQKKKKI